MTGMLSEARRLAASGHHDHALWQVRGTPHRRPARCLSGVVRAQGLPAGRSGQPARIGARARSQRLEAAARSAEKAFAGAAAMKRFRVVLGVLLAPSALPLA